MKIIVDADACPRAALQMCQDMARQYQLPLHTVASFNHHIISHQHTMVGNNPQEADLAVINMTQAGDIVITQDWGLAALVLGKKAAAISPRGKIFQPHTIDFLLEERAMKADIRRSGGRTKGPPKRTAGDNQRFKCSLQQVIKKHLQQKQLKEAD